MKTTRPYAPGELIIEYCGDVISPKEMQRRIKEYYFRSKNHYFLSLENGCVIDSGLRGSAARFANHSCNPNSEMQKWYVNGIPRIGLFASESIPTGTELTYDYNFDWFEGAKMQACLCGADNCRGYIGKRSSRRPTPDDHNIDAHDFIAAGRKKAGRKKSAESLRRKSLVYRTETAEDRKPVSLSNKPTPRSTSRSSRTSTFYTERQPSLPASQEKNKTTTTTTATLGKIEESPKLPELPDVVELNEGEEEPLVPVKRGRGRPRNSSRTIKEKAEKEPTSPPLERVTRSRTRHQVSNIEDESDEDEIPISTRPSRRFINGHISKRLRVTNGETEDENEEIVAEDLLPNPIRCSDTAILDNPLDALKIKKNSKQSSTGISSRRDKGKFTPVCRAEALDTTVTKEGSKSLPNEAPTESDSGNISSVGKQDLSPANPTGEKKEVKHVKLASTNNALVKPVRQYTAIAKAPIQPSHVSALSSNSFSAFRGKANFQPSTKNDTVRIRSKQPIAIAPKSLITPVPDPIIQKNTQIKFKRAQQSDPSKSRVDETWTFAKERSVNETADRLLESLISNDQSTNSRNNYVEDANSSPSSSPVAASRFAITSLVDSSSEEEVKITKQSKSSHVFPSQKNDSVIPQKSINTLQNTLINHDNSPVSRELPPPETVVASSGPDKSYTQAPPPPPPLQRVASTRSSLADIMNPVDPGPGKGMPNPLSSTGSNTSNASSSAFTLSRKSSVATILNLEPEDAKHSLASPPSTSRPPDGSLAIGPNAPSLPHNIVRHASYSGVTFKPPFSSGGSQPLNDRPNYYRSPPVDSGRFSNYSPPESRLSGPQPPSAPYEHNHNNTPPSASIFGSTQSNSQHERRKSLVFDVTDPHKYHLSRKPSNCDPSWRREFEAEPMPPIQSQNTSGYQHQNPALSQERPRINSIELPVPPLLSRLQSQNSHPSVQLQNNSPPIPPPIVPQQEQFQRQPDVASQPSVIRSEHNHPLQPPPPPPHRFHLARSPVEMINTQHLPPGPGSPLNHSNPPPTPSGSLSSVSRREPNVMAPSRSAPGSLSNGPYQQHSDGRQQFENPYMHHRPSYSHPHAQNSYESRQGYHYPPSQTHPSEPISQTHQRHNQQLQPSPFHHTPAPAPDLPIPVPASNPSPPTPPPPPPPRLAPAPAPAPAASPYVSKPSAPANSIPKTSGSNKARLSISSLTSSSDSSSPQPVATPKETPAIITLQKPVLPPAPSTEPRKAPKRGRPALSSKAVVVNTISSIKHPVGVKPKRGRPRANNAPGKLSTISAFTQGPMNEPGRDQVMGHIVMFQKDKDILPGNSPKSGSLQSLPVPLASKPVLDLKPDSSQSLATAVSSYTASESSSNGGNVPIRPSPNTAGMPKSKLPGASVTPAQTSPVETKQNLHTIVNESSTDNIVSEEAFAVARRRTKARYALAGVKPRRGRPPNSGPAQRLTLAPLASRPPSGPVPPPEVLAARLGIKPAVAIAPRLPSTGNPAAAAEIPGPSLKKGTSPGSLGSSASPDRSGSSEPNGVAKNKLSPSVSSFVSSVLNTPSPPSTRPLTGASQGPSTKPTSVKRSVSSISAPAAHQPLAKRPKNVTPVSSAEKGKVGGLSAVAKSQPISEAPAPTPRKRGRPRSKGASLTATGNGIRAFANIAPANIQPAPPAQPSWNVANAARRIVDSVPRTTGAIQTSLGAPNTGKMSVQTISGSPSHSQSPSTSSLGAASASATPKNTKP